MKEPSSLFDTFSLATCCVGDTVRFAEETAGSKATEPSFSKSPSSGGRRVRKLREEWCVEEIKQGDGACCGILHSNEKEPLLQALTWAISQV